MLKSTRRRVFLLSAFIIQHSAFLRVRLRAIASWRPLKIQRTVLTFACIVRTMYGFIRYKKEVLMPSRYLPRAQRPLAVWAWNFARGLSARQDECGVSGDTVGRLKWCARRYRIALRLAINPGTRTKATIVAKD